MELADGAAPRTSDTGPVSVVPVNMRDKLHPDSFSSMSGKMAAIVGYIFGRVVE
jgi:hypothetical protein